MFVIILAAMWWILSAYYIFIINHWWQALCFERLTLICSSKGFYERWYDGKHHHCVDSYLLLCSFCAAIEPLLWYKDSYKNGTDKGIMVTKPQMFLISNIHCLEGTNVFNYYVSLFDNCMILPLVPPFPVTHWGRDEMNIILQTTFSNVFSSMKMF